jgi:hypothetical protein
MAIRVQCPQCAKSFTAQDDYVYKNIKCPSCGAKFQIGPDGIALEEKHPFRTAVAKVWDSLVKAGSIVARFWRAFMEERRKRKEQKRIQNEEFQRTHEPCPWCRKLIDKGLMACPLCGAPFGDPNAYQNWQLRQEVIGLREDAVKARKERRGNTQGCGCLLLLGGIICLVLIPPLGAFFLIVGFILLIVGLCI